MQEEFSLERYLDEGIRNVMTSAYKSVLDNPKQTRFVFKMQRVFMKAEKKRKSYKEKENLHIPTFLISSIATDCNLTCKGCYARANDICSSPRENKVSKTELTPEQWKSVFREAADIGINFNLLAGGEPLLRREIVQVAAEVKEIIFPIFTNGTVINENYLDLFEKNRNLIPIISLEGYEKNTDNRRGQGVYSRVIQVMENLRFRKLFYGTSITITAENIDMALSASYIDLLRNLGCKVIFYIEYVPSEKGTEHLMLNEQRLLEMEQQLEILRGKYNDIMFLSFPGDEKAMGGCLAAGRGFLHISPEGKAEACPFSPYSDRNVTHSGLKEALKSPFFARLRESGLVGGEHTGGCTLFEHEAEVKKMLNV